MGRLSALVIAVLGCLLQLAPGSPTAGTLAVTLVVAVLVLALLTHARMAGPAGFDVLDLPWANRQPEVARQYEPATAGRPQPRAPGFGR